MNKPYVSFCDDTIKLKEIRGEIIQRILDLGAKNTGNEAEYMIPLPSESNKPKLFEKLRDIGIAFSTGREWSPAEQFEELREKGLIKGTFTCIIWHGPNKASMIEK